MAFLFAAVYRVTGILAANCSLTDGTRRDGFLQPVLPSFASLQFSAINTFCRGRRVPGCFLGALLEEFQVFKEITRQLLTRVFSELAVSFF